MPVEVITNAAKLAASGKTANRSAKSFDGVTRFAGVGCGMPQRSLPLSTRCRLPIVQDVLATGKPR